MHTDPTHGDVRPHKRKHVAEKAEGMIGMVMVIAIVLLAVGLIYGIVTTGETTPSWMR